MVSYKQSKMTRLKINFTKEIDGACIPTSNCQLLMFATFCWDNHDYRKKLTLVKVRTLYQWYCYSEIGRWMYSKTSADSAQAELVATPHKSGTRLGLSIFGRQELDQAGKFLWM